MADTCPNEQYVMAALRREAPEKIPSFCQSIMGNLASEYMNKFGDSIDEKDVLLTVQGDLTVYKHAGYSSHWTGTPSPRLIIDDVLRDRLDQMNEQLQSKLSENEETMWVVNEMGSIRGSNKIASWFSEAGIKTEEELKFFLDHWQYKEPDVKVIERRREFRQQCMAGNFVPFASTHVVMEPANQSITFGLTAKLMRKNPELIKRFYEFIVSGAEMSMKASIKAGDKCFCTADDMAYKTGPMLSPENYLKYVTPCAKRICDLAHSTNGVIFMHTDGFIDPVMHCFIAAGYDGIQPLEPTSGMTIERVKKNWGDKLACIGNVDTTNTLSFGNPEEVRQYVHRCFREAKGKSDKISGYIFAASGSLHDKVKLDNFLAMMDEYKKVRDGLVPI